MIPFVIGAAVVAVGASALSWLYNNKTQEEKKRQEELEDELFFVRDTFNKAEHEHNQRMFELAKKQYYRLRRRFLEEVAFFKEEKKDLKQDLDNLAKVVAKELANEAITPYQKQSLLENRNRIEDAKNRLDAYWEYLDWFERKLDDLEKYKQFREIQELEMPQPLLPEDYLYIGKLAYILRDEIALQSDDKSCGWNRFNQRLTLNDYKNKNETDLVQSYGSDDEFMILIDYTKSGKYFSASAIKGELYQYILEDLSFEVQPKYDEKPNQDRLTLLYKDVYLQLKREEKLYPLKRYKEYDSFEVKVKEYDLLLKKIFVSENYKKYEQDTLANRIVVFFEETLPHENILTLETAMQKGSFEAIALDEKHCILKVDTYRLDLTIDKEKKTLTLESMRTLSPSELGSDSFVLPYDFLFIEKAVYSHNYKSFALDDTKNFYEFLSFITQQFHYINYSAKTDNQDFSFFKKWQKIIDYQIEDNSFESFTLSYKNMFLEGKTLYFHVKNLAQYKSYLEVKKYKEVTISLGEQNIGFMDDYILEEDMLLVKVDFTQEIKEIEKEGILTLRVKSYQAVLQKQKKALKDFAFSKMVNQDLKQMLISPQLITYKPISFEPHFDFQNSYLTPNQKEIVTQALNEENIFLVQGPPGTGKTTIIKEMVYQIIKGNAAAKILIVSQQNVAVDNVLDGLQRQNDDWFNHEGHTMIRIAPNENKIQYDTIKELTLQRWFEEYKKRVRTNVETLASTEIFSLAQEWLALIDKDDFKFIDNEIKELLISKHQIVGATCIGLANKSLGLDLVEFDTVIIDEAGRATAPELLIPILRAKKVILIGDHHQLPPTIDRKLLEKLEDDNEEEFTPQDLEILEKSFFEELFEKVPQTNKGMLQEQFRMPEMIGTLVSKLFYEGALKNGMQKDTTHFLDSKAIVSWIDVAKGYHEIEGTSSYNTMEIATIVRLLEAINKRVHGKSVGIITPYAKQKQKLRKELKAIQLENITALKIDTVDSFQGEEADIIIYSTVKTYGNISFLIDKKRLNVAISRTKENLFFVGKKDFFYKAKVERDERNLFKEIIDVIESA